MSLASRIIPVLLYRGTELFKGTSFNAWRRVGSLRQAIRVHEARGVDELVLIDISGNPPDVDLIRDIAGEIFCPLTVGGGVRTLDEFAALIANGADKVLINTGAYENDTLIRDAAQKFGSQAVVVGIDVGSCGRVMLHSGTDATSLLPHVWARTVEDRGAGEILLGSIARDGTMDGYDLAHLYDVAKAVRIPVISVGGAGSYQDFVLALNAGAHAVAAGALWQFTDCTPAKAADYLIKRGYRARPPFVPASHVSNKQPARL